MVPTQDIVLRSPALATIDYLPAVVVAVVLACFAVTLVIVALRRRDAE